MRAGVHRLILLVVVHLGATAAAADSTDESARASAKRWLPGISIQSQGMVDERSARAESDTSGVQTGETRGVLWALAVSAELSTPRIDILPFQPRLFVHADVAHVFDSEDAIVSQGDPGDVPFPTGALPSTQGIENVGSALRVEAQPLALSGGVGAVFAFEAWDRNFRIRPTLEWIYRRDRIRAILGGGENEVAGNLCGPCRILFVRAETEKGFHSLGAGLDLDVEAGRAGDFAISFVGIFRAYRIVGDRRADLVSTGSWQRTDSAPTARADTNFVTHYEREPWHYRFGLGLRFEWQPE